MTRAERKSKEIADSAPAVWLVTIFFTGLGYFLMDGVKQAGWMPLWFNTSFTVAALFIIFAASALLMLEWAERSINRKLDAEDAANG